MWPRCRFDANHIPSSAGSEDGSNAWVLADKTVGALGWIYFPQRGVAYRQQSNDGYKARD